MTKSWQEIYRQSIKDCKSLEQELKIKFPETNFRPLITPHILQLIKKNGADSAVAKQYLPTDLENDVEINELGLLDPISDEKYNVAPGLIHRYRNRALFLPTSVCPIHCRYCFRRNEISDHSEIFKTDHDKMIEYLENHPEINEIIFSGGDPLMLQDQKLFDHIKIFAARPNIKFLRFHTRFPLVLPERISNDFLNGLSVFKSQFSDINFVLHINCIEELSDEVKVGIKKMKEAGFNILSQSVLLKNINDSADCLKTLFESLVQIGVRPYYLHHPDQVKHGMHFQISIEKGRKIYLELRDQLSGWMIPEYIIDLPSGGGKIPLFNPEHFEFNNHVLNRFGILEKHSQEFN